MAGLPETSLRAPQSGIRAIGALAARVPDAIRLHVGDPDFNTPAHIIDAAARDAHDGYTKYTPSAGLMSLRERIAEKLEARNGIACTSDQVVVTAGGCGALFTSLLTLIEPGDEVLVPDPGWANNIPIVAAARGVAVHYPLDPERGFEPDLVALRARIGPRARALIVNTPGNPTGCVYTRAVLEGLLTVAEEHDLWVISDECYDDLAFDEEHTSVATLGQPGRTVSVFSFSKSYAMTGWRVGYTLSPPEVATVIGRLQEAVVANAASVSQRGAEAALTGSQEPVATMRDAFRARRDAAVALLRAENVRFVYPRGAFYLMVDVSSAGGDDEAVCRRLLEQDKVAVVPGSAFGPTGAGFARVSLSSSPESVQEGLQRLVGFLHRAPDR